MANLGAPWSVNVGNRTRYGTTPGGDDPLSPVFATSGGPVLTPKTISGHVYDTNGAAVVGATVALYRQTDGLMIATATSVAGGAYTFLRRADDTKFYYTVAYSIAGGSTQVHGVSNRGLVPA